MKCNGNCCAFCVNYPRQPPAIVQSWLSTSGFGTYASSCNCKDKISVLETKIEALFEKIEAKNIKINELIGADFPQQETESAKKDVLKALEFIKERLEGIDE